MKALIAVIGPTAVGKTDICIRLAQHFNTPIINADSRQIYKELNIGTASPCSEEKRQAEFLFVDKLSVSDYYSAARFEQDALAAINQIFTDHDIALLSGGSMMYVDAVTKGIDDIPTIDDTTRTFMRERLEKEGLEPLVKELAVLDPDYYKAVDRKNARRIVHALEICYATGKPYSSFRTNSSKNRPFRIIKVGLSRPRQELYERINARVDKMFDEGLLDEAQSLYPLRHLNALNTVGYNELFRFFDGTMTLSEAKEKIKRNTRVYAKKQITWYKRDEAISWFHPDEYTSILKWISSKLID